MKYNKLIRDKVLEGLDARNIAYKFHIANSKEYNQKLHSKLLEES